MSDPIQNWYIRAEGETFDARTGGYTNLFSIKFHYGGRFTDASNKKYVEGEVAFVEMIEISQYDLEVRQSSKDESDLEDGKGDTKDESASEDGVANAEDIVDEEHIVDEVEVNMSRFKFEADGDGESEFIYPIQPHVTIIENDLEVSDFDSLEIVLEDVPENERSKALRKLRKKAASLGIRNNFYVGKEFANKDASKERIKAYSAESRRNIYFKKNDMEIIKVIRNGVVLSLSRKDVFVDKSQVQKITFLERVRRKKAKAQVHLRGDANVQYPLLRDYVSELQRGIYLCLGALKKGSKAGGRELLGLDGESMRGKYLGQMLTTMGVDANNGIYLVTYGIVELENQYSWTWFLSFLSGDLDLFNWKTTQKRKKSKGEIDMVKGKKLSRKFKTVTYTLCKGTWHNKRGCPTKLAGSSKAAKRDTMPSERMTSQHVPSQRVPSQPVPSQVLSCQVVASQARPTTSVASQTIVNQAVAKKCGKKRTTSLQEVCNKDQPSHIANQAATQASHAQAKLSQD
ncbi:FAR1-related sequence 10 [Tanacetum coccineum]|uniref:FAR1-related sequence 10 n=1 Tax=Tanacetum coccineum TaxID=301880 RepID=A0ABQ5J5F6_9ASTR